jgi:thiol-disulfide isomerase/thioredoxin
MVSIAILKRSPLRAGFALAWLLLATPGLAVQSGDPAPEWELETGEGETVSYPGHADGAPSVLFFWATWCPYCHAVMPYLETIQEEYAADGVRIYAINFKDDGDPVAHMAELGHDFIVLPLGDLVADDYGVWGAPGLIVVDGGGTVVYRRGSTEAPPGKAIAEQWDGEIRAALQVALQR